MNGLAMNNVSYQTIITKMVSVVAVLSVLLVTTACGAGFQIQDAVSQIDSVVNVRIQKMISDCQRSRRRPTITTFVFNFWQAGCYESSPITDYPQLFNDILNSMRRCSSPCSTSLSYTLPTVPCTGQAYPNTFSINYECSNNWQLPQIVITTITPRNTETTLGTDITTGTTNGLTNANRASTTTLSTTTQPTTTTTLSLSDRLRQTQRRLQTTTFPTTATTTTTTTTPTTTTTTTATDPTTTRRRIRIRTQTTTLPSTTTTTTTTTTARTTTETTTASTTSAIATREPVDIIVSTTTGAPTHEYQLVAEPKEGYDGYLSADLTLVVCRQISHLHVLDIKGEIDETHPCQVSLSTPAIETQLQNRRPHISQSYCLGGNPTKVQKLTITYECLGEMVSSRVHTTVPLNLTTESRRNVTLDQINGVGDANQNAINRDSNTDENMELILGIVVPLVVMLILIPLIVFIIYKRRSRMKPLLGSRDHVFDPDGDIYQDPTHAFNYSQMNCAYSNENLDDNALYQDPALLVRPGAGRNAHRNSIKSKDSDYQDPNSLACTGPPGTPSPIRDALHSTYEDPSTTSDIYVDVDGVRGDPDGMAASVLRNSGKNVYDMPFMEVSRPLPPPRNGLDTEGVDNRQSIPSYTHMIVTDGQLEPHNYAIIRKSRPVTTESMYYELENEVELYDSPVYNSVEDLKKEDPKATEKDNDNDEDDTKASV